MKRVSMGGLLVAVCIVLAAVGCRVPIQFPGGDYPNGHLLVSADFLETILGSPALVVIDARASGYTEAHIPGAIHLLWNDFVDQDMFILPPAALAERLGDAGLRRNMTFVIYDDTLTSGGAAGRIFWMLEYLGCNDVHILNGGWDLWVREGRETEATVNTLPAQRFIPLVRTRVLSTKDTITARSDDPDFVLIDSRTDEEFNGWQLYGEQRGGHIPGAVQISYEWFFSSEDTTVLAHDDLLSVFTMRGITADKEVAAYSTAGVRSGFVYFALRLLGYQNSSNYAHSIYEWAADPRLEMKKMANYQALVYPAWVDQLIKDENPQTYPGNGYVILYSSYEPRYSENRSDYLGTNYEIGHIPGAVFMDTYGFENGPNSEYGDGYQFPEEGNVKPIPELQQYFGSLGITKNTTVVVYADDDITMMTAGRTAWALLLAGVDDVRLLNGNYAAWVRYGGEIETTPNEFVAVEFGNHPGNPEYLATTQGLLDVVNGLETGAVIVDDRSWEEFIGESNSYYQYFYELGRIPGSVWIGDWWLLTRDNFQFLRNYTEVEQSWLDAGFNRDQTLWFYCGTGWRSGLYAFYAYLIGWPAANYDGGWFEWTYYDHPRETGMP